MSSEAYLGLGSNVGRRGDNLAAAVRELDDNPQIEVVRCSRVYEAEPVGEITDQRDFLNAAIAIRAALAPMELLSACKAVEERLGRRPGGLRHGPRTIDIDILTMSGYEGSFGPDADGRVLALPHPEILSRRFVLVPLLDLDPDMRLSGRRLSDCLGPSEGRQRVVPRARERELECCWP